MAIYLVVPLANSSTALDNALQKTINASDRHKLQGDRGWLVKSDLTSVELSHEIGVTSPNREAPALLGSAIIVPITSYYGRGPTDMWEWLKTRIEK